MKKIFVILLGLAITTIFSYGTTHQVEAKTNVVIYKNCKELNKVYPGGVAKSANVKNKGGKTHYKPYASSTLYNANSRLDRDHDLIACER